MVQGCRHLPAPRPRISATATATASAIFAGLTSKLDYLQDLGVTAIWLLPFYPSPLRDDGYDIADYRASIRSYGTLRRFPAFLRAAHDRGLRVITEMVLNHTSDQHPWFQRARAARPAAAGAISTSGATRRTGTADARIIFKDFEPSNWTWDPEVRRITGTVSTAISRT